MCIEIGDTPQVVKNGELKLWKVMRRDNQIGLWAETGWCIDVSQADKYHLGVNVAKTYKTGHWPCEQNRSGAFHCFFTRKEARKYMEYRYGTHSAFKYNNVSRTKIVRVYANGNNVVAVGLDSGSSIRAISVSKMEIKSLNHQR